MAGDAALARSWIPADYVLLRNAVEAGASLESLAKGAVDFSRKFTVQELRDRWASILYDPVVAQEASSRMAQIEHATPDFASKFSGLGSVKEDKCDTGKRKAESVRDSYYAQRRRICCGPFDPIDFDSMFAPDEGNYIVNGDDPLSEHVMTSDPVVNHFGLDGSDFDDTLHHTFPDYLIHDGTVIDCINTVDTFEGSQKPTEEDFLVEQGDLDKENLYIEDYLPITGTTTAVEEFRQPKNLLDSRIFSAGDVGTEHLCLLGQINDEEVHMCSPFEGNQVCSLTASEGTSSYHDLDYSTQLTESHIWTVPATSPLVDICPRENDTCTGDSSIPFDDFGAKDITTSEYDVDVGHEFTGSDLKFLGIRDDYLVELSHSLLNFTEEEEELMKKDEGGLMSENENGNSYYDSLSSLLSPKNDIGEVLNHLFEPGTFVSPVIPPMDSTCMDLALTDDVGGSLPDDGLSFHPEMLMESPSASNSQFPENNDGVICCVLNTEQWEIPCNDDMAFPIHVPLSSTSSNVRRNIEPNPNCASVKDLTFNQKKGDTRDMPPSLMPKEQRNPIKSHCILNGTSKRHPSDFELSKSNPINVASTSTCHVSGNWGQVDSAKAITNPPEILKEYTADGTMMNFPGYTSTESYTAHPHLESYCARSYPQPHATETDWEPDASTKIRDHPSLLAEIAPLEDGVLEPEVYPLKSDLEDHFESDDDIPCCSDIEAMILDMDLNPDDQEIYSNEEVSRYQNEDSKRAIMRLEQGAYSYMQRAIASHGALAILYGRHSKHYIKKPEVVLGRTTEGLMVDIDLTREGSGNKVSRQQATLKLEKDGSFCMKNLGSCSISVNSTELTPGQSLRLGSNCLIEIRSMVFIFEVNQTRVKKYLDSITQGLAQGNICT